MARPSPVSVIPAGILASQPGTGAGYNLSTNPVPKMTLFALNTAVLFSRVFNSYGSDDPGTAAEQVNYHHSVNNFYIVLQGFFNQNTVFVVVLHISNLETHRLGKVCPANSHFPWYFNGYTPAIPQLYKCQRIC